MHLYLIRHADPDYAHDTLTPQGFKEARALARRMAAVGLTHLYSSPLPRALLTAQAVTHLAPVPIVQEDWLVEPAYLTVAQDGDSYKMWDIFGENVRSREAPPTQETWNRVSPFDAPEVSEMWRGFRQHADELLACHGYMREGYRSGFGRVIATEWPLSRTTGHSFCSSPICSSSLFPLCGAGSTRGPRQ